MTEREDAAQARVSLAPAALGPARCSGALSELAVADVVQLLQLIGKSAVMTVTVAHEGGQSRLWCAEGSMIDAESGRLRGEAAAYRILALDDGWLEAELRHEARTQTIHAPTQRLLLEAARRTDETLALKRKLGGVQCCYRLVHEPEPEQLAAPTAAELRMLRLLSAAPSVGELLAESELGDLETLITLERWFEAGHLAKVGLREASRGAAAAGGLLAAVSVRPPHSSLPATTGLAPSSAPSPSVPPLVASVPPLREAAQPGAHGASHRAMLAAGALLLAAASFASGYLLRDGPAGVTAGAVAMGGPAGEPLDARGRTGVGPTGAADALASPVTSAAGSARGTAPAASPDGQVLATEPAALPVAHVAPVAELPAELAEQQPEDAALRTDGATLVADDGARAEARGSSTATPATLAAPAPAARSEARRTSRRTAAGARRASPVLSEPRVRVIGATEPSIRVLD